MKNTLIDNTTDRMMVDALKECILDPVHNEIMIATGFWDLPGTKLLINELSNFLAKDGTSMRLLIGTDPVVRRQYLDKKFPDEAIKDDIFKLQFNEEYQPLLDFLFKNCKENPNDSKLKIRIYKRDSDGNAQFLHSKCYIFRGGQDDAVGIIGSSNFTQKGLEGNAELNYVETDARIVNYDPSGASKLLGHTHWFNEMWDSSEDWNGEFIKEILSKAPIAANNPNNPENLHSDELTPYEVFIKYLQTQFGDIIDEKTTDILKSYLPATYNPLEYQLDAVKQGFSIMKRYGGFILGDVVGLGKTVVGLMTIRMFLDQAELLNRRRKVLVIVPPSIKSGWVDTIKEFDRDNATKMEPCIDFITTGSISSLYEDDVDDDGGDDFNGDLNQEQYGLIVIDESHNFRNKTTQKYKALDDLIGLSNPTPYICLLSATPQNNTPTDLYNQISLFIRDTNNCNLPNVQGGKLDSFFNAMRHKFDAARNMPADTEEQREEARKIIAEVSKEIRERVLNELVVRRTRTDIKKLYPKDSADLRFPTIVGPRKLEYNMDEELAKLFYDTMYAIYPEKSDTEPSLDVIHFTRYAAITFFKDINHTRLYEKRNLTVESITKRLQKIMKILLVKRLESSLVAFKTSLANLLRYTDVMISMFENNAVYICPDIDINKIYLDSDGNFEVFESVIQKKMQGKPENNRCYLASDFKPSYIQALKDDRKIINKLLDRWNRNDYDPKFEKFKQSIPTLFDPAINNPSGANAPRVVIFTEAIDTLKAVERALKNSGHRPLAITSENRDDMSSKISANFDANLKQELRKDDYDAIVTTEVLAEGVNLHRANIILNYDAPWNATRLMQRIGRVNRIGSVEESVHVFNFFPSNEGNQQIRLIEKAYAKIQSFHEMFGEDSKVFSEREEVRENDLKHTIDGDESPFGIYIRELKDYAQANPDRFAFIKSVPMEHLGGHFLSNEKSESLYIFADQSEGLVSVTIDPEYSESPTIISPLKTIEYLHCSPSDHYIHTDFNDTSVEYKAALRSYQQHVTHALGGRDSNKYIKEAQEYVRELRNNTEISKETKELLKQVNILVRNKNNFVIKTLLKHKKQTDNGQASLFGVDFDINSWLQATFAHLASQAVDRRGESTLAFFVTR